MACIKNILQAFIENRSEVLYQKCYILVRKKCRTLSMEVNFALHRFCRIIFVVGSDLNNYYTFTVNPQERVVKVEFERMLSLSLLVRISALYLAPPLVTTIRQN